MVYDNLLDEADKENIYVIENAKFQSKASGLINNDVIGINKNVRSSAQRSCILAEELGHYHTSSGNILDQSSVTNRKQELHARAWAYNRLIGLYGIINAYRSGCRNGYEIAEHLNITEEFLAESLQYYRNKYGLCTTIDNYVIYFEPSLGIFEQI
nr:MAG TPA: IrrE protein [Caudoviricetes sp.]